MPSQLEYLRSKSAIDCDTLDATVASTLGPFVDCTSNQAIAYGELCKPHNAKLLDTSTQLAKTLSKTYPTIPLTTLTTEVASISLSLLTAPYLTGRMHVQTNPYHSFSTKDMILNAQRLIQIFAHISPSTPKDKISIKIPSTWEGLQACRELEKEGIRTLATTLFCMPQVVVAGKAGCTYIAPYINRLIVHFDTGCVDARKGFGLTVEAQRFYEKMGWGTQVLPASLTSTDEVMMLAGAHHITISPVLLQALAKTEHVPETATKSLFDISSATDETTWSELDESSFRLAMNQSGGGDDAGKLVEAINIFCDMQKRMEDLCNKILAEKEAN